MIYLSSSFYGLSIKGSINLTLLLANSIITFILSLKGKKINRNAFFLVLIIVISSILTIIVNTEGLYQYLIFWASLLSAYLIYISIDIRDFVAMYTRIIYFICIFSLITFAILLISPNILNYFPTITNHAGLTVHNLLFSVIHYSNYFNANYGLFWEPGAYQTFINFALFFQIFVLKDLNVKKILVYLITLFTTFSTTGYLAALMIIVVFILTRRSTVKEEIVKRKKIIATVILLLLIGIFLFNSLPGSIKFKVFGKLEVILNPELARLNPAYGSTTARTDAIKISLINWLNNPFFGVGFTNLYDFTLGGRRAFLTATPLNWFALFGFPLGIILNYCIWGWTKVINRGVLIKILIFLFLTFIALSEYYNMNAFYLIFIMYGFTIKSLVKRKI